MADALPMDTAERMAGYWDVYMWGPDRTYANFNNMGENTFQGLYGDDHRQWEGGPSGALQALFESRAADRNDGDGDPLLEVVVDDDLRHAGDGDVVQSLLGIELADHHLHRFADAGRFFELSQRGHALVAGAERKEHVLAMRFDDGTLDTRFGSEFVLGGVLSVCRDTHHIIEIRLADGQIAQRQREFRLELRRGVSRNGGALHGSGLGGRRLC